jgi:cobyrinic acid a,c-diamide synthase
VSAPGLLVAAPRSSSGKTTVALALMRALTRRGLRIRAAKCGPDYIDPAFHRAATGRPSFNLDSFAMAPPLLDALASATAESRTGANADIAARFGWPVVLVVDVSGAAQSAAAVALGCKLYDPRVTITGVILNKVASARHRRLVEAGMERVGLPVLGVLMRDAQLVLPERHLGLVQAGETTNLEMRLDRLADLAEAGIDLDAVTACAGGAVPVATGSLIAPPGQRIAVARDAAFSFLYPHIEAGWRMAGAELVPFSPLADESPHADCDVCWLPGGYPELHAGRLARASRFMDGLRNFAQARPVHGECGGYMVLGQSLEDADGATHAMAGLLPVRTSYHRRKLHLGYRVAKLCGEGVLGRRGARLVGHEFHYASEVSPVPDVSAALAQVTDAEDVALGLAGHRLGTVTGSFFHVIAAGQA